jgi:anti-anti-sigma factor
VLHEPLRLTGEIDLSNAPEVERVLFAYADGCDGTVVVDCADLEFIDSAGVRALVSVGQRTGCTIVLLDTNPTIRRLIELTGLDSVFELR